MWKYFAIALLLVANGATAQTLVRWPDNVSAADGAPGSGGSGVGGTISIELGSAAISTANSGFCLNNLTQSSQPGTACTTFANTAMPIFYTTGIAPRIVGVTCVLTSAPVGLDAAETVVLTPLWLQGDGAGTIAAGTAATASAVTFTGTADDDIGDQASSSVVSVSPFTGSQLLQINSVHAAVTTTGAVLCEVIIQ